MIIMYNLRHRKWTLYYPCTSWWPSCPHQISCAVVITYTHTPQAYSVFVYYRFSIKVSKSCVRFKIGTHTYCVCGHCATVRRRAKSVHHRVCVNWFSRFQPAQVADRRGTIHCPRRWLEGCALYMKIHEINEEQNRCASAHPQHNKMQENVHPKNNSALFTLVRKILLTTSPVSTLGSNVTFDPSETPCWTRFPSWSCLQW